MIHYELGPHLTDQDAKAERGPSPPTCCFPPSPDSLRPFLSFAHPHSLFPKACACCSRCTQCRSPPVTLGALAPPPVCIRPPPLRAAHPAALATTHPCVCGRPRALSLIGSLYLFSFHTVGNIVLRKGSCFPAQGKSLRGGVGPRPTVPSTQQALGLDGDLNRPGVGGPSPWLTRPRPHQAGVQAGVPL